MSFATSDLSNSQLRINLCMKVVETALINNTLTQGLPIYNPRARCGPRGLLMRPMETVCA